MSNIGPGHPLYERKLRRNWIILDTIAALSFASGIYDVYAEIQQIDSRMEEIVFYPDIGAAFALSTIALIHPFYLLNTRVWKMARPGMELAFVFLFLALGTACMFTGRYAFEAKFKSAGYHKCTDHELVGDNASRRSLFDAQAWVLDPGDCIMP